MTSKRHPVTDATRMLLFVRAQARCELCGRNLEHTVEYSKHHRRPRGMGGSRAPWINDVTNLLLVCGTGTTGCHGHIESHRATAYVFGWLLRSGELPNEVPVHVVGRGMVYLTDDGRYAEGAP